MYFNFGNVKKYLEGSQISVKINPECQGIIINVQERITLSFVTIFSFPISFFCDPAVKWDLGHVSRIEHIPIASGGS